MKIRIRPVYTPQLLAVAAIISCIWGIASLGITPGQTTKDPAASQAAAVAEDAVLSKDQAAIAGASTAIAASGNPASQVPSSSAPSTPAKPNYSGYTPRSIHAPTKPATGDPGFTEPAMPKPSFKLVLSQPPSNYGVGFLITIVPSPGFEKYWYTQPKIVSVPAGAPCNTVADGTHHIRNNTKPDDYTKWGWGCVPFSTASGYLYGEYPITFAVTASTPSYNAPSIQTTEYAHGVMVFWPDRTQYENRW